MSELARRLFGRRESFPVYVSALLHLRDIFVKPLNLKTASDILSQREGEQQHDQRPFFELLQESDDEVVLGEDDRHLDFRVSLLRSSDDGRSFLTVSTFVRMHNPLGRIYFAAIRPFHRAVVASTMGKAFGKE